MNAAKSSQKIDPAIKTKFPIGSLVMYNEGGLPWRGQLGFVTGYVKDIVNDYRIKVNFPRMPVGDGTTEWHCRDDSIVILEAP